MDERARELYKLPPEQFTKARNELAGELAAAGDRSGAASIKALKKPSLAAWAVNQLARGSSKGLAQLVELRNRLKEAASIEELRAATEERARLVARLVDEARDVLIGGGHAAGASTLQKVAESLLGARSDEELAALVEGRLERELESTGFDDAFRLKGLAPTQTDAPKGEAKRAELQRLREELREAEQNAERAVSAAEAAERAARRAADEAARAQLTRERARSRYEDAKKKEGSK